MHLFILDFLDSFELTCYVVGCGRLIVGPISSVFDICTFSVLWYYFGANNAEDPAKAIFFETGWFIESLFTQVRGGGV